LNGWLNGGRSEWRKERRNKWIKEQWMNELIN